jgi:hypothetical protein
MSLPPVKLEPQNVLPKMSMPDITWSTTSIIRWELKCEPGSFFEINRALFLAICISTGSEEDARAQWWNAGKIIQREKPSEAKKVLKAGA